MAEKSDFPESYRDPLYAQLDAATEQRLGLPSGLLASVRSNGEKSNHSQTNEEKTFGVYQITPATRKAILEKYGLDVTLSPENASLGAGYLLQEGMKRNGGDPAQAVGEYIGGIDRANWGRTTKSYINRVMVGWKGAQPPQPASTFDRVQASMQPAVPPDAIARVYAAYQAGEMTPEERSDFEADVKAGKVMLPKGASLQAQDDAGNVLPQGVLNAYFGGQMSAEEKAQLQSDVKNGYVKLPPGVQLEAGGTLAGSARASQIPGQDGQPVVQPATPEPSLGQKIVGAGEAALTTATGLTGGTAGMVAGTVGGLAGSVLNGDFGTPEGAQRVEQAASEGAQALTYAPRTPSGQAQAQAVGDAMGQVLPALPLTNELASAGRAVAAAKPAAQVAASAGAAAAKDVGAKVAGGFKSAQEATMEAAGAAARKVLGLEELPKPPSDKPTPGTMGSVGAAGTDVATQRTMLADELMPADAKLTKGQATRNYEQQRFEKEIAKDPVRGQPIRDRIASQNAAIPRKFDDWVDLAGSEKVDLPSVGDTVTQALRDRAAREKVEIRAKYKEAEKAGAMEQPVDLGGVVRHLNENAADAATAPLMNTARQWAIKLGIAEEAPNGQLVPVRTRQGSSLMNDAPTGTVPIKTAETFRQAITRNTDFEPTNIRQATIIKGLIDQATEGKGGELYRQARLLRRQYAERYENFGLARDLLNNKRGMSDAIVPAEKVFQRAILSAPMADVKQIGHILKAGGEAGRQAWAELQGAALRHIRDKATENAALDERGNRVVSFAKMDEAVNQLDRSGKLDYMFGKKGAEQVRSLRDLAGLMFTSPPGAVNTSNSASVILAALDMATSGIAGMPLPIMSGLRILTTHVRDRKIQHRINDALGIKPEPKKVKAPQTVVPPAAQAQRMPESRTVH